MLMKFEDLIGKTGILCAVDDFKFRIGNLTFEAVENEKDGYRSMLDEVKICSVNIHPLFRENITIINVNEGSFEGYALVNELGLNVLTVGTDHGDDYYPRFRFEYSPEFLTVNFNTNIDNLLNTITE